LQRRIFPPGLQKVRKRRKKHLRRKGNNKFSRDWFISPSSVSRGEGGGRPGEKKG